MAASTTITVSLDEDVIAYLDEILKPARHENPSDYINQLLRQEMRECRIDPRRGKTPPTHIPHTLSSPSEGGQSS